MIATRQGYKIGFRSHSIRDFTNKKSCRSPKFYYVFTASLLIRGKCPCDRYAEKKYEKFKI